MDIKIINKRAFKQIEKLKNDYIIIDVTSKSDNLKFSLFSPFYPHGDIPIPKQTRTSMSVEGVWQGLKIIENYGPDYTKFNIKNMKNIKRTGNCIGHQFGEIVLKYQQAREEIYIPTYNWVLENKLKNECKTLKEIKKFVLLDYYTNEDITNLSEPLSHASLIKKYCLKS